MKCIKGKIVKIINSTEIECICLEGFKDSGRITKVI